jgi:predicted metal-dependent phosphoesterase TrpH
MTSIGVDLHMHSYKSDGALSPKDLINLAVHNGGQLLALTDHDTTEGLADARETAKDLGIWWWNGVEISVSWGKHTIHIVGLGIDSGNSILNNALDHLRSGRWIRAKAMADGLASVGIYGALEGALALNQDRKDNISRTHFARYLVQEGVCPNTQSVFKRFLTEGKPGFVPTVWADLDRAIYWIQQAGGYAVLAHPGRYKMSRSKLVSLINAFRSYGGVAIEVVSSSHTASQVNDLSILTQQFELMASSGSDFHALGEIWRQVGKTPTLKKSLTPIWTLHPNYLDIQETLNMS